MTRLDVIGKHKTKVYEDGGYTRVKYHFTDVVTFNDSVINLDTGGWESVTTKARMNQASRQFNLDFSVYQRNYKWFVDFKGETIEFKNGMATLIR